MKTGHNKHASIDSLLTQKAKPNDTTAMGNDDQLNSSMNTPKH